MSNRQGLLISTGKWILMWTGIVLSLGCGLLLWQDYHDTQAISDDLAARKPAEEVVWEVLDKIPTRIFIPSQNIDLEIVPGTVVENEWEVSDVAANYLIGSGVTGDLGNVVVYAHKRPHLFANLVRMNVGDRVQITAGDVVAVYEVMEKQVVEPDNVRVLESRPLAELTLYTCEGWRDDQRLVLQARLVKKYRNGFGGILAKTEI